MDSAGGAWAETLGLRITYRSRRSLVTRSSYVALLGAHWGESQGGFSTLAGVASLFANPWLLLAGWVHYLAFDLFIGGWQVRDAVTHGISHLLVIPCLIFTFLFGPAGLLLYFCVRFALRRRVFISHQALPDTRSY